MKKIEFSQEDCERIVDMYKNGVSLVKIGECFNCTRNPIKKVLIKHGIEIDNVLKVVPKSESENIARLYNDGMSGKEIAKKYNCPDYVIYRVLKNMKVQLRPNGNTFEVAEKMNELYKNGRTVSEIAEIFGVHNLTVGRVLRRNGFATDRRKYHFNEHYFDIIDTHDKAYILGLLWADGHNDVKRGKITIVLQARDKHILEDINNVVDSDRGLFFYNLSSKNKNWQDTYTLTLQSRHVSDVLLSYGMLQQKSLVLKFPTCIDESLYPSFIRGYFDGDGSVSFSESDNRAQSALIGTKEFLDSVVEILSSIGVKAYITQKKNRTSNVFTLGMTSKHETVKFLNWIYNDANLKLDRKYKKYQQIIEWYNIKYSFVS